MFEDKALISVDGKLTKTIGSSKSKARYSDKKLVHETLEVEGNQQYWKTNLSITVISPMKTTRLKWLNMAN